MGGLGWIGDSWGNWEGTICRAREGTQRREGRKKGEKEEKGEKGVGGFSSARSEGDEGRAPRRAVQSGRAGAGA